MTLEQLIEAAAKVAFNKCDKCGAGVVFGPDTPSASGPPYQVVRFSCTCAGEPAIPDIEKWSGVGRPCDMVHMDAAETDTNVAVIPRCDRVAERIVSRPGDTRRLFVCQGHYQRFHELDIPPAHASFRAWCKEQRGRRLGLARLLGLSAGTVGSWGRLEDPGSPREPFHVFAVAEITGIPVHAWLTKAELAKLEPILQNFQLLVQTSTARRHKLDPRQMHFDDLVARQAPPDGSGTIDCEYDEEPQPPTADDDFDVDAAMG
jgi:hypothetical protein